MMTIAQFAERTGISASALRFWEAKGLLEPADRLDNNYRLYADDQIPTALLVHSLREAGVPMAEIRAFLDTDGDERGVMIERWRRDAAARLLSVQVAARWLGGIDDDGPDVHLVRWDEPSTIVWLPVSAAPGPLCFAGEVAGRRKEVERSGARVLDGGYARTLDLVDGRLVGELGFRVAPRRRLPGRAEAVPATVFATLECRADDDRAAHRVFRFVDALGLAPDGAHLERYLPGERDRYQLMIAVRPCRSPDDPPVDPVRRAIWGPDPVPVGDLGRASSAVRKTPPS